MEHSDKPFGHAWGKAGLACSWMLAIFTGLALSMNVALAQEDADEEDEEALELRDVKVTGSRLNRPPSELSGNLIVLDREAIRASGELTLARVLRQLPQNANPTNETFGSRLNGAENRTGAATVNLRGLGSESTLILVDGRRVGYSGILGGVTDISTIPLSMVDRIEILLDGASAVYGSDAVGGVVNIITRQDYSGLELDINYSRPHKSGFNETRVSLATGLAWSGGRAKISYEHFRDSGLDASHRDSVIIGNRSTLQTTNQKNTAPGPQARVFTYFYDDQCPPPRFAWTPPLSQLPVFWDLADGTRVTHHEYLELDEAGKANATCRADVTLPPGFQYTDDLSTIDLFLEPHWGEETEVGYSLRPEQAYDVVNLGVDQQLTDSVSLHANLRLGRKDSNSQGGLNFISATLNGNSPFNPFGVQVDVQGLAVGTPPRDFESQTDEMFARLGAEGSLGSWTWQAEFSSSRQEIDSTRYNERDPEYYVGVGSDGTTHVIIQRFRGVGDEAECEANRAELGGSRTVITYGFGIPTCSVYGAPPPAINPFGDISPWIIPNADSGSKNEQTQFEALARGNLFNAPGGPVALVVGYDYRQDVLDSFDDVRFSLLNLLSTSPNTYAGAGAPVSGTFNTRISRDNHASFLEALVPLIGSDNAMAGVQRLSLTFSGRYDSYTNVEVDYRVTTNSEGGTLDAADPGAEFTWSSGLVYRPADSMLFKANLSTSFVAPQLNQLLFQVQEPRGSNLAFWNAGGGIGFLGNVVEYRGGNDALVPETADSLSLSGEFSPHFLPGVFFKAGWSETDFKDRIIFLSTPIVFLDDLPSTVTYDAENDLYIKDNRWINAAAVYRSGMDYELRYEWQAGLSDFAITVRRGYTNRYEVQPDAGSDTVHDIVSARDDTGPEDTTLSPVAKHQTSAQFTWTRGGLFLSLDVQGADTTKLLKSDNRHYISEPATNYDMVLGYEFGDNTFFDAPAWMNGLSTTLTINNFTNAYARNSNFNPETGESEVYLVNPFYEWTQGRSYRLAIHKSF